MPDFKLELIKILRSKKIILALLISLFISSFAYYWNHTNIGRYGMDLFNNAIVISQEIREKRADYQKIMSDNGLKPDEIRSHMILFTEMENEMRKFERIKSYEYRYEIPGQMVAFYEAYEKYAEDRTVNYNGKQFFNLYHGDYERVESEKAFFQELVDLGLPYEDPFYSLSGTNFLKAVIDLSFGGLLALFIVLMVVDIFSGEKVNGTERVRLIQPVKRRNIFLSKLFASLVYVLFILIFTSLVSYLLAGVLGSGFGSVHYPVQSHYVMESTGISVGEYIALGILFYSLYLLFVISCIALLAAIVKETSIVAVMGMLIIIILNPLYYQSFDDFTLSIDKTTLIMVGIMLSISALLIILTHYLSKTTLVQNFALTSRIKDGGGALLKYENQRNYQLPYFRFEVLKIIKKKTTIIPFILLLAFVMVYGLGEGNKYEEFRNNSISLHQSLVSTFKEQIAADERVLARENIEPERREGTEVSLRESYAQYNMNSNAVEAYKNNDIGGIVEAQRHIFQYFSERAYGGYPVQAREVYLAKLGEIGERGVQPVMSGSIISGVSANSPFAFESSLRSNWEYSPSQPSITFIFNSLFKNSISILILAVFAISLSLGFSDETHDTRTIYLLNTQPMKRKRIYFGKLLAQSVVFLTMVTILVGTLFIGLRLSGSPMEGNFPAVQYKNQIDADYTGVTISRRALTDNRGKQISTRAANKLMGFSFRNMSVENTEMVAMLVLSGLVMIAFAMLISLKIPNKIGVSLGTFLIFGLGYLASRYILKGFGIMLPFIWLNQPLVASGEASMIFNITLLNSILGMLVLSLWLATLVYFGYRKFIKEYGRG